jgi:hypothetical protein
MVMRLFDVPLAVVVLVVVLETLLEIETSKPRCRRQVLPQKAHPKLLHVAEPLDEHELGQLLSDSSRCCFPRSMGDEALAESPPTSPSSRLRVATYACPGRRNAQFKKYWLARVKSCWLPLTAALAEAVVAF